MTKNKIIALLSSVIFLIGTTCSGALISNKNIQNQILLAAPNLNDLAVVINTNQNPLVLYNSANSNSAIESYISVGEMLNYQPTNNPNFYKVTVQETGSCGYISAANMQIIQSGLNKAYNTINRNGQIINVTTDVKLMSSPDVHSQILGSYKNNVPITILGKQDQWYKVIIGNQEGYIYQSYIGIDNSSINKNLNQTNNTNVSNKMNSNVINSNNTANTGSFANILNNSKYMTASIDGTNIVIPFNKIQMSNNQLILPEYYTNELNEKFTAKITSLPNNKYIINEYYGNTKTAIMNLKYYQNNYESYLQGTFEHIGSNIKTNIKFNLINKNSSDVLSGYPFHTATIGGTSVTIAPQPNTFNTEYIEYYANDKNAFNLSLDYNLSSNYKMGFLETYNGETTGEYLLNPNYTNDVYNGTLSGVFISKPHTNESKIYNVTLKGSYSPN